MKSESIAFIKSIGGKITSIFAAVVIIAIALVTGIALLQSNKALMHASFNQLTAIREIKKGQIESYFAERHGDLNVLTSMVAVMQQQAFKELEAIHANQKNEMEALFTENNFTRGDINPVGYYKRTVDRIFGERTGLGKTGESYLMEYVDGRYIFRSDMQTMGGGSYVFGYDLTANAPEYLKRAHAGESDADVFTDSAGNLVMVVFSPLQLDGFNFALVTKMDLEEAIEVKVEGHSQDFFTDYTAEYGYYDLFLIHPDGEIFYSVAKEKDLGTNILNGEYADSSLGVAVRKSLDTLNFGFGDFQPYAPSNGEPAAFISQPIVYHGEAELIIALQLSLETINGIMQERTGMGETGESYLVGPDKLMRSDSYLDPENHSVTASFARPELGSVDTAASQEALRGETGSKVIIDYNGNPVLSAYTSLSVYDTKWALMSEIDEAEVRQPINRLTIFILISALTMVIIASAAAILFSRTISKPILLLVSGARNLAVGDIDLNDVDQQEFARIRGRSDELGIIGTSFAELTAYQREKAEIAKEIASKNLQVDVEISSERDTLGHSFTEMVAALNQVLSQVNATVEQVNVGADQVSQASQNLSQGATEQASSLEEVTSSITEINGQSKQNAESANEAHNLARLASDNAGSGRDQMEQLTVIMERINASSDEINKVVKVIDDIAFQINLLALNANVEAARAGKYGRGFAVVAEEVRNLAARSAEAVKETSQMVGDTVGNIKEGSSAADETAKQLLAIVDGTGKVAGLLDEIAAASREQALGIDQINEGLDQIDQATQANTASAEESAAASEELAGQAQQLRNMVAQFRLAAETRLLPETTQAYGDYQTSSSSGTAEQSFDQF